MNKDKVESEATKTLLTTHTKKELFLPSPVLKLQNHKKFSFIYF